MWAMDRLLDTMRRLRAPDGCPWDQEQTHESLRPYLLEEAAEATDALEWGTRQEFVSELGDVLLQIAFHAVIGEQEGTFTYGDVEEAIVSKLVRRHPHVFGDVKVSGADDVRANWLQIKEEERRERGETEDAAASISVSLPVFMQVKEAHEKAGLKAREGTALPAGSSDAAGLARHIVDLALLASEQGIDLELAVRDEIRARLQDT